jgi:hypothetical protein
MELLPLGARVAATADRLTAADSKTIREQHIE